ncbi:MAG: hypothetical protein ACYDG4_12315 [Desulfuromonadaceae bacterium]
MNKEDLKKLRKYYHTLLRQQPIFDEEAKQTNTSEHSVGQLATIIKNVETDFPDLLPSFNLNNYFSHRGSGNNFSYYVVSGIRSYLATALGILEIEVETDEGTPVTETKDFSFVKNSEIRRCLERDYTEIQRAFIAQCWKSVIVLSGGAIEAILTDLLISNSTKAKLSPKAPKQNEVMKWDLADLINVSVELDFVSSGVEKLSHSVREYRNLVHPGNEIRNKLTFNSEEAKIALEVLHIVHRDLSL